MLIRSSKRNFDAGLSHIRGLIPPKADFVEKKHLSSGRRKALLFWHWLRLLIQRKFPLCCAFTQCLAPYDWPFSAHIGSIIHFANVF